MAIKSKQKTFNVEGVNVKALSTTSARSKLNRDTIKKNQELAKVIKNAEAKLISLQMVISKMEAKLIEILGEYGYKVFLSNLPGFNNDKVEEVENNG